MEHVKVKQFQCSKCHCWFYYREDYEFKVCRLCREYERQVYHKNKNVGLCGCGKARAKDRKHCHSCLARKRKWKNKHLGEK